MTSTHPLRTIKIKINMIYMIHMIKMIKMIKMTKLINMILMLFIMIWPQIKIEICIRWYLLHLIPGYVCLGHI